MRIEWQLIGAAVVTAGFSACATAPPTAASEPSPIVATSVDVATAARSLQGSTREDVVAVLGPATLIRFDSGNEVWLYRFVEPPRKHAHEPNGAPAPRPQAERDPPRSELVMLFTPSGIVAKIRVRTPST